MENQKGEKKRRRRKKAVCLSASSNLKQPAGFKDTASSCITVNKILYSECCREWLSAGHILRKIKADTIGCRKLASAILKEDVGVQLQSLGRWFDKDRDNYRPWMDLLLKFLKKSRRLTIYTHIGFKKFPEAQHLVDKHGTSPKVAFKIISFVIRHVIPLEMFGSKRNRRLFVSSVKRMIFGCSSQAISISSIMNGFKVSDVPWLAYYIPNNCVRHYVLSCTVKWFLRWTQFLIRRIWYVTESSPKAGLVFFRKPSWNKIKNECMQGMITKKNLTLTQDDASRKDIVAWSSLRFFSKPSGLRPISLIKIPGEEISREIIQDAKALLNQIIDHFGSICTPFSGDIGEILQHQLLRMSRAHPEPISRPQYYFVRVDMKDAYGSIDLLKMTDIFNAAVRCCIPENCKVEEVHLSRLGRFKKTISFKYFHSEKLSLKKRANWQVTGRRKVVFVKPLLDAVRRLILNLGVKHVGSQYHTTHGLPQGMILSSALCELYYLYLENHHLKSFINCNPDEMYVRYCDDYIFITPCCQRAMSFLNTMEAGFPDFSCQINSEKTATNVHQPKDLCAKFLGFSINTETFNLAVDFDKYQGANIRHTMSFARCTKPGRCLKFRMTLILKMSPVLLDRRINSKHTALSNLYQVALFLAFRFHAFVQVSFPTRKINQKFLQDCIRIGVKRITNISQSYLIKLQSANWIQSNEIKWLVFQAFRARLRAVSAHYSKVLYWLKMKIEQLEKHLSKVQQRTLKTVSHPALPGPFASMR